MAFNDMFRLSAHAVITNVKGQVLQLKATYGDKCWGLPGGALEIGETIHQAVIRECLEELGCDIEIDYLSGVYFHSAYQSQVFIFKCSVKDATAIKLSAEHSEYQYFDFADLSKVQQIRIKACFDFTGQVDSKVF
ncbi:NUDIX hydrolase [Shewanella sp. OMA3-2]|uniref:NUDIX hydrolase n=1 Tax=Shewanella sp. OMA3-2 TaxID=2908650 RepID=UPI001F3EB560|nr:NUDIX domain-containing protein [Shewanella sp. OMA3-2]UJF20519.1 NUDIX domain-containing protein [Shewanella sp. OMA3-2]